MKDCIAIVGHAADGTEVVCVDLSESSSLDTMSAFARLGYRRLRRFWVDRRFYRAYANGAQLVTDVEVEDGVASPTLRIVTAADRKDSENNAPQASGFGA